MSLSSNIARQATQRLHHHSNVFRQLSTGISSSAVSPSPADVNNPAVIPRYPNFADREKRYVRIAGPSSYASKDDVLLFLQQHGISDEFKRQALVQGQSDVFQNHSVWVMETDSQSQALDIVGRISGRVLGLKLIRAAAVDQKLYDGLVTPSNQKTKSSSLRKRMSIIAPTNEERGRALLARHLQPSLYPRTLWSFFSGYDVVDVRHLRRSGVACIIFESEEEACRALRERKNVPLLHQYPIALKMHD